MIKILIGYILIILDLIISPNQKAKFDLLPDFIGYVLFIYTFYKIWKTNKNFNEVKDKIKISAIVTIFAFIVSYVSYVLDMYGVLYHQKELNYVIAALNDFMFLAVLYFFIKVLESLQGDRKCFQVKRMMMLLKFIALCSLCKYIALPVAAAASAFFIFEQLISIIFAAYIFTSDRTYKSLIVEKENEENKQKQKEPARTNTKKNGKKVMNIRAIANSQMFSNNQKNEKTTDKKTTDKKTTDKKRNS